MARTIGPHEGLNAPIVCGNCGDPRTERMGECAMCEAPHCAECMQRCAVCGYSCCERCQRVYGLLTDGRCEDCVEVNAEWD